MSRLNQARVALLEARMSSELAALVRRLGGEPLCAPAVREATLDAGQAVATLIDRLSAGEIQVIFFLTGVGVKALLKEAEHLSRLEELLAALRSVTTVARGPKPSAVLKHNQVPIAVSIQEPYTTTEILAALDALELEGRGAALLHYGERNEALAEALLKRGARLEEVCLYEWQLPEDVEPLELLIGEIIGGRVDAVAFTSQIQARHLFQIAAELGEAEALREALNAKTVVAAVGPTCAAALESVGVTPQIVPQPPKMGPMVVALAEYLEQKRHRASWPEA
jgi:uroporphyrinogen-III synthase